MAKSNLGSLAVYMTADTMNFNRGMLNAQRALYNLKNAFLKISSFIAAGSFLYGATRAAIAQESADYKLANSLSLVGANTNALMPKFKAFASEMQSITTHEDDAIEGVMAYGLNLGITSDKIQEATKAAIGLGARLNMDVGSALRFIALAQQGNTQRLARYGIVIDSTLSKQDRFNSVLKIGTDAFSLAKGEANTTSGRITQLGNTWGDFKETVGQSIMNLVGFQSNLYGIKATLEWFNSNADIWIRHSKEGYYIIGSLAIDFMANFEMAGVVAKGFFINIWTGLKNTWAYVSTIFNNSGNVIVGYFKDFGSNIMKLVDMFKVAVSSIANMFVALFQDIGANFSNLGDSIVDFMTGGGWQFNIKSDNLTDVINDSAKEFKNAFSGDQLANTKSAIENIKKEMAKPGFTEDYFSAKEQISVLEMLEKERIQRQADFFKDSYEQATKDAYNTANKQTVKTTEKISAPKFSSAITQGSMEDYKATLSMMAMKGSAGTQDKTEKNTGDTVKELQKLNDNFKGITKIFTPYGNVEVVTI